MTTTKQAICQYDLGFATVIPFIKLLSSDEYWTVGPMIIKMPAFLDVISIWDFVFVGMHCSPRKNTPIFPGSPNLYKLNFIACLVSDLLLVC